MSSKNLSFSLIESNTDKKKSGTVTYDSLVTLVNEQTQNIPDEDYGTGDLTLDDYMAAELDYNENYTKKQLDLIADYYEISKRKKKENGID